jgi:hypothetical protein
MKLTFAMILFCLFFAACKSSYQSTQKRQMKQTYIYVFKLTYFTKILIVGFNNSEAIKAKIAKDGSGYGEPLLSAEDYRLIDSFIIIDNAKMVQDSINRIGKFSEGIQGKHVLTTALYKFQSKWLDNLAKERYRIYKRKEGQE